MAHGDHNSHGEELAISEDFVQSPTHKEAGTSRIDFGGLLQPGLTLHQDLAKGNGGQAWPAGVVLTKYLLRKRDELKNCTMSVWSGCAQKWRWMRRLTESRSVELGAGGGLVGLAIAVGCRPSRKLYITDQEPMLALMQKNIALNNLNGRVEAHVYNWGEQGPPAVPDHPDVILAADCVYFEPAFSLLRQTLQDLVGPRTVCYFCFKKRRRADLHFMKAARKMFLVEAVEDDPDCASYTRENIFLYKIRLKPNR